MSCIKCNFEWKLTKSYIGHEDNASFILWNNSHYGPVYYHPYQRKAFRFFLADNYKLIFFGPLHLGMALKTFTFSSLPFYLQSSTLGKSCLLFFSCIILKNYYYTELFRCGKPQLLYRNARIETKYINVIVCDIPVVFLKSRSAFVYSVLQGLIISKHINLINLW